MGQGIALLVIFILLGIIIFLWCCIVALTKENTKLMQELSGKILTEILTEKKV